MNIIWIVTIGLQTALSDTRTLISTSQFASKKIQLGLRERFDEFQETDKGRDWNIPSPEELSSCDIKYGDSTKRLNPRSVFIIELSCCVL